MSYLYVSMLAAVASVYDLKEDRIPNYLVVCGFLGGFLRNALEYGLGGVATGFISAVAVLAILFPVYLIRGIGAGDVKLASVIAMFFDPEHAIRFLLYFAVISAVIALSRIMVKKQFYSRLSFLKGYVTDCMAAGRVLPYHTAETVDSYVRLAPCMLAAVALMYCLEMVR